MTPVPVLETRALSKSFGHLKVTQTVDFALAPGAGKSTFINLLTGMLTPGSASGRRAASPARSCSSPSRR